MKRAANETALAPARLFYGWIIVASVFFTTATAAGTIYAFPAFFDAFSRDFAANRFEISLVFAISECVWFSITYVHLVPNALDHGISAQSSITLVGVLGVAGTLGRFLLGGLADRVGRRHALGLMFVGLAAAMAWWLLAPPTVVTLMIYAVVFGAFYGGYITVLPVLTMDFFGGRRISSIIGFLYTSWAVGALGGPPLAGFLYEASGSYFFAILTGGLFMGLAALSCFVIREPQHQY